MTQPHPDRNDAHRRAGGQNAAQRDHRASAHFDWDAAIARFRAIRAERYAEEEP